MYGESYYLHHVTKQIYCLSSCKRNHIWFVDKIHLEKLRKMCASIRADCLVTVTEVSSDCTGTNGTGD